MDNNCDKTIAYYNQNAESFAADTAHVDFKATQDKFLNLLQPEAYILDFGCGSGRDTKYFLAEGMKVDAVDGSKKLCEIAKEFTGVEVKQMFFGELNEHGKYHGIWACSSILHLQKYELKIVLEKMAEALVENGIIYTSFKYGDYEGERNGRYFTDFTLELFAEFIRDIRCLKIEEYWITGDVRPGRGEEKWLNLILRKNRI